MSDVPPRPERDAAMPFPPAPVEHAETPRDPEPARRSPNEAFTALRESVEAMRHELSEVAAFSAAREQDSVSALRRSVESLLRVHAIALQARDKELAGTIKAAVEAELQHLGLRLIQPAPHDAVHVETTEVVSGETPSLLKTERPGTVTRLLRAGARLDDGGAVLVRAQVVAWRERT